MKKFVSIILSISLLICIPITVFLICINIYLQGNSIQKQINKIDREKFKENIKEIIPDIENEETREQIEAISHSDFVQEATALGAKNAIDYIRTGKGDTILSKQEYEYLIDKHMDEIVELIEEDITVDEKKELKKVLKDSYEEVMEEVPSLSIMDDDKDIENLKIIKDICNPSICYTALGITILLSLILIWLQRKRLNFIPYLAVPALLNGILFLASSAFLNISIREMMKTEDKQYIVESIFKGFSNIIKAAGIMLTGLSILSFIFLIIIRKRKIEQKA